MGRLFKDITGQVFGKLTALERKGNDSYGSVVWLCRCECGELTLVSSSDLRKGKTKSCGCSRWKSTDKPKREKVKKEEFEVKKDCFGYNEIGKGRCMALNRLYCQSEHCNFYKPRKDRKV